MASNKAMSINAFQTNLKKHYEENGEIDVESRVEMLTSAIVKQNEGKNPFIFSDFLKIVESENIRFRRIG